MSDFEDQRAGARQISSELAGVLIALGVDWNSEAELRSLARDALAYKPDPAAPPIAAGDIREHARLKFYGLIALMLRTMEEGAEKGEEIHGDEIWKAVARALWAEKH